MRKLIRYLINLALGVVGLEVRKRNSHPSVVQREKKTGQPSTDLWGMMHRRRESMADVLDLVVSLGFTPVTVIDVGVASGTFALYTRFPKAKHLLIEPIKEFEEHLRAICGQYNAEYVLAAASSNVGTIEIGIGDDLTGSSILRPGGERRSVPVVTLDNLCRERGLSGPYVVKADVQGAELLVLDGAVKTLQHTELVLLEVSFFKFGDRFPDFYEVIDYMKKRNFVVYEIFGGHNRPLDGAKAQAIVAFVKEDGIFKTSNVWATPEQKAQLKRGSR
jgi:FkbM family methyltransferase